jgi:hypothetical protein
MFRFARPASVDSLATRTKARATQDSPTRSKRINADLVFQTLPVALYIAIASDSELANHTLKSPNPHRLLLEVIYGFNIAGRWSLVR